MGTALAAQGGSYSYVPIVFPSAHLTLPTGLNNSGEVVGFYQKKNGPYHGFVFANGSFTNIDPPGSSGTVPTGLADDGTVVGYYQPGTLNEIDGFTLKNGAYSFIGSLNTYTYLTAISGSGIAIGKTGTDLADFHTWFSLQNGRMRTKTFGPDLIDFVAVNDNGVSTGEYRKGGQLGNGSFIYRKGVFSSIPLPINPGSVPYGLNDAGTVVGQALDDDSGYLYDGQTLTRINYPGAVGTVLYSINSSGVAAGSAILPKYPEAMFTLSNGQFTKLTPPGLTTAGAVKAINDAGQVIGDVLTDPLTSSFNGLLATPN